MTFKIKYDIIFKNKVEPVLTLAATVAGSIFSKIPFKNNWGHRCEMNRFSSSFFIAKRDCAGSFEYFYDDIFGGA